MPLEIERKYLLASDAWRREVCRRQPMAQGYLVGVGGKASIRVRVAGDEARLNIKAAVVGAARAEYDYGIPLAEGQTLLATLTVGTVEKTRHYVERDGLTWEIDEFHGDSDGLIVAEVELEAEDQAITRPDWLGAEVTDKSRYYNHALSQRPYCQWSEAEQRGD
tara:strand:+ start:472 stop:963 length:492 start_codon:yes stop_codon:yes gene_type:complete